MPDRSYAKETKGSAAIIDARSSPTSHTLRLSVESHSTNDMGPDSNSPRVVQLVF
jgi:hypothetical protein